MTFEMRTYTSVPGRRDDLLTRFREHTVALFTKHGIASVGYWTPVDNTDTLIYILRHEGDPAANWREFQADPAWIAAKAASIEHGEIVAKIESVFVTPTDFSPIR